MQEGGWPVGKRGGTFCKSISVWECFAPGEATMLLTYKMKNLPVNILEEINWNWCLELKLGIETSNWNIKLGLEIKAWNWNLKLKLDIETWNWNLKLKLEFETWNRNLI